MRPLASTGSTVATLLVAAVLLAGSATQLPTRTRTVAWPATGSAPASASASTEPAAAGSRPTKSHVPLAVPAAMAAQRLPLSAAFAPVPLELRIPSLGLHVSVLAVGMNSKHVMDAPMGPAASPVWQQAFWYRGSAMPGLRSTALFAGHIDDPLGRPGVFADIDKLRKGDLVVVHDTRSGLDVRFAVTTATSYPLDQTTDPAVLSRMYGTGPVNGKAAQHSVDGLSHLTLVTCAGTFDNGLGTHNRRLVVFATRIA
ncbi:MAG TPA: class F sortase [Acidimicrobiia bacterium]